LAQQDENLDVTLNKLLRVAIRRRWWLLAPAFVIAMGAGVGSTLLPNHYQSEATIHVEHLQVPEPYLPPNGTSDVRETLLIVADATLPRTQLLQIVNEFDLYPKQRKRLAPEELTDLMRDDITIEPIKSPETRNLGTFTISFKAADPHLAQQVTNKLTSLFIEENSKSHEAQSTGTTNFLVEQLQAAVADLNQQEARVRDFKMRYLGELPEQQQGNLQILAELNIQLQNTSAALGRAREQQVYLESLISQYGSLTAAGVVTTPGAAGVSPTETIKAELTRLRNERADLLARYTDKYPDVVKIDEQIKRSGDLLAASTKGSEPAKEGTVQESSKSARLPERDATTAQLKSQLEANRLEIQDDTEDAKQTKARIAEYQRRLNLTPVHEQELAGMLRDYNLSKQNYDDLLNKKTQSELATSLERHPQGQQFRIIDPPSLPMKPSGPAHIKISLGGLAAGIALGVALAFLTEARDHSLRDEEELRRIFAFPLMVGVPMLLSQVEEGRRSRVKALEWFAGVTLCLLVCATEFYVYRRG